MTTNNQKRLRREISSSVGQLFEANAAARQTRAVWRRYHFLAEVYRLAEVFGTSASAKKIARVFGWPGSPLPDVAWFIDNILRFTSADDRRLRSKHASALKYAAERNVAPETLVRFIKRKGGINACVTHLRNRRRNQRGAPAAPRHRRRNTSSRDQGVSPRD